MLIKVRIYGLVSVREIFDISPSSINFCPSNLLGHELILRKVVVVNLSVIPEKESAKIKSEFHIFRIPWEYVRRHIHVLDDSLIRFETLEHFGVWKRKERCLVHSSSSLTILKVVEKDPNGSNTQLILRVDAHNRHQGSEKGVNQISCRIPWQLISLLWKLKEEILSKIDKIK